MLQCTKRRRQLTLGEILSSEKITVKQKKTDLFLVKAKRTRRELMHGKRKHVNNTPRR